ncbi:transcriptional repressor [Xinfangfangia sp. D13-10-4-6]|uniref:Fur family transcriptional regulator n=1 Tax=Pseudogemmobacter hezensis TaxID=2737662 RepID=UPI001552CE3C|nr:Fur family transcriptional regulator [Pseudogemmobacter hezensis]NPD15014.1 transcriptional repressor [Pseudogemmobacter hezensis]
MLKEAILQTDPRNPSPTGANLLDGAGLRSTRPRRAIAAILFGRSYHHFTAEEIFAVAAETGQRLSMATVYNTLNEFAAHGLIRRLATAGGPAQFDIGTGDHHHFHVEADNRVIDIPPEEISFARLPEPPQGYRIANIDVVIRLEPERPRDTGTEI